MNEFMKQLERWNEEDEYQKIVDAIEALPREERRPARPMPAARPASRPAQHPPANRGKPAPLPPSGDQAFEDKLKQFLSSSEGKMADLNRSMDGKRGGRRRR